MTREQAIEHGNSQLEVFGGEHREFIKLAIKALEQEPIIDKIRAEIDKARFIDKDTRIAKNALASGLEVAMQIIDKYKTESEG